MALATAVALSHWKAPGTIPWHVPNYGSQLTISPSKASLVIGPLTRLITLVSLGLNRDPALEIQQYPCAREEPTGCRWDLKAEQHWEPHSAQENWRGWIYSPWKYQVWSPTAVQLSPSEQPQGISLSAITCERLLAETKKDVILTNVMEQLIKQAIIV